MFSETAGFYAMRTLYCKFSIMKEECYWWQFSKKKLIQDELDWVYPLMKNEIKNFK